MVSGFLSAHIPSQCSEKFSLENEESENEYLFTVTGVKKMKLFLSLTKAHFQPRATEGHEWLEMHGTE